MHRSESAYPHNFRLVAFSKRSYVERRRNDIASCSIAMKDFLDNFIGSISLHFVQARCLARVTALAVLCSSSNILTFSLSISLFFFGPTLENTLLLVLTNPARLVCVTPMIYLIRRLNSASWAALMANYFIHDFISGYTFRMTNKDVWDSLSALPDCWDRITPPILKWISMTDPLTNDRIRFFFGLAFILAHVERS